MTIAASIIFILLATYWFGFKEGFFSGLIHLACVIVAGAVAFAFWSLAVAMLGSSSTREGRGASRSPSSSPFLPASPATC